MRSRLSAILMMLVILTPNLYCIRAALTDDLQNEINQKQSQIQELEKQIAQYNEMLKTAKSQGTTLKTEVQRMETQIKKLESQVRLTQTKISEANLQIQTLTSDIETKNIELEKTKVNLGQILRTIYEYDDEDPFSLVLQNDSFSDFLNQVQYMDNLQTGAQQELKNIKDLREQMENQKADCQDKKAALEDLKKDLHGQTQVLDNEKDQKQDLLNTTKNQEKQYQATLTTLEKQRQQIENEIAAAEAKLRAAINQNSITGGKGAFIWPLKTVSITQAYGCIISSFARKSYPACTVGKNSGGYHNGLDLDGDTGDPIYAVRNGTVAGTGNLGKYSYGKWVAIKHDNGLTTLYGHLSAISVSAGQKVTSGQTIGYMGSTGYSTGSHLHFTVYATNTFKIEQKWYGPVPLGGDVNPRSYLP